jgi:hypothetical protein
MLLPPGVEKSNQPFSPKCYISTTRRGYIVTKHEKEMPHLSYILSARLLIYLLVYAYTSLPSAFLPCYRQYVCSTPRLLNMCKEKWGILILLLVAMPVKAEMKINDMSC